MPKRAVFLPWLKAGSTAYRTYPFPPRRSSAKPGQLQFSLLKWFPPIRQAQNLSPRRFNLLSGWDG